MPGKWKLISLGLLVMMLCLPGSFAQAARGPLHVVSVTLTDGAPVEDAADIPVEPQFKVYFDKNVVSGSIWKVNRTCFSLVSADQENIPVSASKIDDFAHRQIIFVQPVNPLKPGMAYTLQISPALTAKNGTKLGGATGGEGVFVAFQTQGEVAAEAAPPDQSDGPAVSGDREKTEAGGR